MVPRVFTVVVCLCVPLFAQQRVDPRNRYERVLCVVPMVGAGTPEDPRRPAYAPLPPLPGTLPAEDGIAGYTMVLTDDGAHAIVEFVARDRSAFKALFADKRADVKVFEKGKTRKVDIETEFRKVKQDFNLDELGTALP